MLVYIIDDDEVFADCLERLISGSARKPLIKRFSNVISAINSMNDEVPDIIFLDILLDGPDGFTLLNEMASYSDTEKVPIVIVSSLDIKEDGLDDYGVVAVLNKAEMTPESVKKCLMAI